MVTIATLESVVIQWASTAHRGESIQPCKGIDCFCQCVVVTVALSAI